MDINEICAGVADQVYEITKNYSREQRLAFIQGMLTMIELFELSCKLAVEEEGTDYPNNLAERFSQIKESLIAVVKNM